MKNSAKLITGLSLIGAINSGCAGNITQSKTGELIDSNSSRISTTLNQKCLYDYNSGITNCFDVQKIQNISGINYTKDIVDNKNIEEENIKKREAFFEMIENYMGLADSIIQIKTIDINKSNDNLEIKAKKIEEFEKKIRISEQVLIKEILLKRRKMEINLPLTPENIKTFGSIMNSIEILWTNRYEHNTELVNEINPIIISKVESKNYYLYILFGEDKFNNKIIKNIKITKGI